MLGQLFYEFCGGVTFRWNCHVNEHAPSFFLVFDHNVRSVGFYFPEVCAQAYPRVLWPRCYCCWLVFIPLLSCLDFTTSADLAMNVCCCLVMQINLHCFR